MNIVYAIFLVMMSASISLVWACSAEHEADPAVLDCTSLCVNLHNLPPRTRAHIAPPEASFCSKRCRYGYEALSLEYGAACQDAMREWLACVAPLDNEGLNAWNDNILHPMDGPCGPETILYFDLCPGVWLAPGALPDNP